MPKVKVSTLKQSPYGFARIGERVDPTRQGVQKAIEEGRFSKKIMDQDYENDVMGEIWGLFADPDGGNPVWDFLTAINPATNGSAKAVASEDGRTVLIGTASGRIFSYDSPSGVLTPMKVDPSITAPAGELYQFSFLSGGVAMARFQKRPATA